LRGQRQSGDNAVHGFSACPHRLMTTFYDILRIKPRASPDTIEVAYRKLLDRYDPDKHQALPADAGTRVRHIMAAYFVLSDPAKRHQYDARLAEKFPPPQGADAEPAIPRRSAPPRAAPQSTRIISLTPSAALAALPYAGFGRRYTAVALDVFIILVPLLVVGALLTGASGIRLDDQPNRGIAGGAGALCFVILFWIYNAVQISGSHRSTWGMRALLVQVVDANTLTRVEFARATRRYFVSLISALLFFIGYLIQPFTKRRQALHDIVADTVVLASGRLSTAALAVLTVLGIAIPLTGVIAAVGLPAYREYALRSEIGEALDIGEGAKKAVESYYRTNRSVPLTLATANAPQPPAHARYQLSFDPGSGLIVIKFDPLLSDKTIMYAPGLDQHGDLSLLCVNQGVPAKYLRGCNSNQ